MIVHDHGIQGQFLQGTHYHFFQGWRNHYLSKQLIKHGPNYKSFPVKAWQILEGIGSNKQMVKFTCLMTLSISMGRHRLKFIPVDQRYCVYYLPEVSSKCSASVYAFCMQTHWICIANKTIVGELRGCGSNRFTRLACINGFHCITQMIFSSNYVIIPGFILLLWYDHFWHCASRHGISLPALYKVT